MTAEIYVAEPEAPIAVLHGLMTDKRIRHVPVVDEEGALVGLVSDRDLLRCAFALDEGVPLSERLDILTSVTATDIMTREVDTIKADDDLAVAARMMLDNKYGCLPVLEEGVLMGIITEADFVRLLAEDQEDDEEDEEEEDKGEEEEEVDEL
jgi:CBS domain-containing membrane protein